MDELIISDGKLPESLPRPAFNLQDRIEQIGNSAMNLAEKQILEGTASSQVITYFLKAVSEREKIELENLREENKKLKAQTEALQSAKRIEDLYSEAIDAFRGYQGVEEEEGDILQ